MLIRKSSFKYIELKSIVKIVSFESHFLEVVRVLNII